MTGGQAILGVSWATVSLGTILVSLRIYSRASRKALSWDDYVIVVAAIICLFVSVSNTYQVLNGGGQHVHQVHPAQFSQWLKWTVIAVFETTVATCLVKISICLLILRILGCLHQNLRRLIIGVLAFLVVFTLAFLIVLLLQCRPLKAAYDLEVKGQCYSKQTLWSVNYALGAYNVLTDFFCASLPAFIIRDLQMSTRNKYALSALMGLGIFTATCSIVRLATLSTIFHDDAIYHSTTTEIFTILEQNLGVTVACLPTLRGMFRTVGHFIISWSTSLRSLLVKSPTSAKTSQQTVPQAGNTKATTRCYHELRDVPTALEEPDVSESFVDFGGEKA